MSCLMKDISTGWSTAKATKSANHADVDSRRPVFPEHQLWSYKQTATARRNINLTKRNVPKRIL